MGLQEHNNLTTNNLTTCLSNGRYTVFVTGAGAGFSTWNGYALTNWSADRTEEAEGVFVYLRDLDRNRVWSVGHQPTRVPAESHSASCDARRYCVERLDDGIETRVEICVASEDDVELRRVSLRNLSEGRRHIEVTSYAEVVLNHPAAHAAHPAFSKLFVQTEFVPPAILLAHRRPRSHDENPPWMMHALLGPGTLQYETDRLRFVGRGRDLSRPLALTAPTLTGSAGNVLDPIFSLRRSIEIKGGEAAQFFLLLGAAPSREAVIALARRYSEPAAAQIFVASTQPSGASLPQQSASADLQRLSPGIRFPGDPAGSIASPLSPSCSRGERSTVTGGAPLLFDSGYGGFSTDGSEYVIRLGEARPPMPWVNVVANEGFAFLVSESGAGYTWSRNSRQNRLTPWYNDPVTDPYGEALYIRDEDAGVFWSPLPGPASAGEPGEVRHGFGYTRWRQHCANLDQDVRQFVPRHDPVKITCLRLANTSDRPRRLSVFSYSRLVLGVLPVETSQSVVTEHDGTSGAILARNPANGEFSDGVVFATAVTPKPADPVHSTGDRTAFIGRGGSITAPAAVCDAPELDGRHGAGLDPCAALQMVVQIEPHGTVECAFLLGETTGVESARALIQRYGMAEIDGAWRAARDFWNEIVSAVQVKTPSPALDLMVNGWLLYQTLSCRIWGRSAFYQSGGAFGFRDQLQDSVALTYTRPDMVRQQILLHANHQFVEGDVLHWWHPPADRGIRTRFSDDLLWLPYLTAFYVHTTGDWRIFDEPAAFLTSRALEPGEDEAYLSPEQSGESADVYTHCCRALDRSLTRGAHGLPLMGTGDWNDGMNRVGREGRGESVWVGFFLYKILDDFIPVCERRADPERAQRYRAYQAQLRAALNDAGWDGSWYRRAYYDDGTPLGSAENQECRIDALAQAWAVLSKAAPPERAAQAMEAVEQYLVSPEAGLIRLLAPPFDKDSHDPGYIKGYTPGIRENGGQYTHAAIWVVQALAELGQRERAAAYLEMLSPIHHSRTKEQLETYQVEPYVVAADIYGAAPHLGRGGWTWYTGSAGWMYRAALESVLGFHLEGGTTLCLRPCIPDDWPEFRITYRLADGKTRYEIMVHNPTGCAASVQSVTINDAPATVEGGCARVPLVADGGTHGVVVVLG